MRTVRPIRPGPFGSRRRSSWPLTGRTGTAAPGGRPSSRAVGAPAATSTAPAATVVAVLERDARDALARDQERRRAARRRGPSPPARAHRRGQRGDEPARVDGVVARRRRAPAARSARAPAPARRACAREQPLDVQADAPAVGEQAVELLGLVAVARHDERAGRAQARVAPGGVGELRAEGREAARPRAGSARAARSSPNCASATGASMPAATCHAPGSPASSTQTSQPAPRGVPRAREADRTAADDGDVRLGLLHRQNWLTPSLRRHDPDQVRRSAPRWRPLSPIAGSRMAKA